MAIRVLAQRNALAARYATEAPYGCLFTADPGTGGNATNEVTGGSPAYARKAIGGNWASATASASAVTGSATFDVASSTTVDYIGVAVSGVAGTNDVRDSADSVNQTFASQGTYTVTYTYTQS